LPNEVYVIDGYNLLLSGFRFDAGHRDLERQRAMLEVLLREFRRTRPELRVIVVYDGVAPEHRPIAEGRQSTTSELEVVFSSPPQIADDVVIDICRELCQKTRVTVVTSDRKDIVSALERSPVRHRSSQDFALDMQEALELRVRRPTRTEEPVATKPSGKSEAFTEITGDELEKWVKIFGEETFQSIAEMLVAHDLAAREEAAAQEEPAKPIDPGLNEDEVDEWMRYFDDGDSKN
jgi:predicted RNA-binding protein with PIN domain